MPKKPCPKKVAEASNGALTEPEAQRVLEKLNAMAETVAAEKGRPLEEALKEVIGELAWDTEIASVIRKRNHLLNIQARRRIKQFAKRFKTVGEGVLAFIEGSAKKVTGGRNNVDYNIKAIHGSYLGRITNELEQAGVWKEFMGGKLDKEIYLEMEARHGGTAKSATGNPTARKIADIVESVTDEMVSRQNRAGALIRRLPGYLTRQTHDQMEIRRVGGTGHNKGNIERSFGIWMEFILPRLDKKKTFGGSDPKQFLKNVHRSLYTGTHGPQTLETELVTGLESLGSTAKKVSQARVLHFKDALSAYEYNQVFGMRSLKDQIMNDLHVRSRSIGMMEAFGPDAEANFDRTLRELAEEVRDDETLFKNIDEQADSLKKGSIKNAFEIVSGLADMPVDYTWARRGMAVRTMFILSKMANVMLSAFSDKAFMNAELAYQGIGTLERWGSQFAALLPKTADSKQRTRLAGAALDGLIGSVITRYTSHSSVSSVAHDLQQKLFKINFMNWWTDGHKAASADLMMAHLGEHADLPFEKLPEELTRVLDLYEIEGDEWNVWRQGVERATDHGEAQVKGQEIHDDNGTRYITPQALRAKDLNSIQGLDALLRKRSLNDTVTNRRKIVDDLEQKMRVYIDDRSDFAVPTPGAREKRITIWGATRPGTPLGEAARLLMMFKSFPITILTKIWGRQRHGFGAESFADWLMNPRKGSFHTATLLASTLAMGYMSGVVKDLAKGRTPKRLLTKDGQLDLKTLTDAMQRGGGMGIFGDFLFNEYDRHYRSFTAAAAGPVVGQLDPLAEIASLSFKGEGQKALKRSEKFFIDNTPFINLFYIRPILDYMIFWQLQEALEPGSLKRVENAVIERNNQDYWLKPSEVIK